MWQPSTFKRALGAAVFVLLAVLSPAQAANFSVDPIILTLGKGNSSGTVAITNQSQEVLRLQVTGYSWQQSPSGEMQLTPTDDLVFFPQSLTLAPGETHRVRVGINVEQGPVERTFRIFMEELPSLESVILPKSAAISIRMKIGVPVFVSPNVAPAVSGAVRDVAVRDNELAFDVANTGNTHFSIQQVHVVGKSASGADVLSKDLTGWYVLPGGTRRFVIPLAKTNCAALATLSVQVRTDATSFGNSFPDLSKQCGRVSRL